jgi:hypothetical protein
MGGRMRDGDCVRLPDGRVARIRGKSGSAYKVRVRRKTSNTHQFIMVKARDLPPVPCPKGWMSPDGYRRYLHATLAKLHARQKARRSST